MYDTSEEAMEAAHTVSVEEARRELKRHFCRIICDDQDLVTGASRILVTNDMDEPEWIGCDTRSILIWLGY